MGLLLGNLSEVIPFNWKYFLKNWINVFLPTNTVSISTITEISMYITTYYRELYCHLSVHISLWLQMSLCPSFPFTFFLLFPFPFTFFLLFGFNIAPLLQGQMENTLFLCYYLIWTFLPPLSSCYTLHICLPTLLQIYDLFFSLIIVGLYISK